MAPRKQAKASPPPLAPPLVPVPGTATGGIEQRTSMLAAASGSTSKSGQDTHVPLSSLAEDPLPTVVVNNANLVEIKSALDDIVKKHLLEQSFTPSLLHPTVHLSLGYSSILLALGSVLFSLRVSFEDSKPVLWLAVIGYSVLQSALWAWKKWVEKGEVFKGRRRRMVKRIETDHVQIISSTTLTPPPAPQVTFSPHTRPQSPTSAPTSPISTSSPAFPAASLPASSSPSSLSTSSSTSTAGTGAGTGPSYMLTLNLSTTSNNGKSLIHKSRATVGKTVGEFIDEQGGVEAGQVVRWLTTILSEAGLVGAEEEGVKEE
ncbi:hypothetical protein I317_05199 [Kwoniella heveanensis CBS 569]|nr:hypothetical protein I317_05199 [Kwoniella heveanensis CBS 569]